jgi:hypothetical protein
MKGHHWAMHLFSPAYQKKSLQTSNELIAAAKGAYNKAKYSQTFGTNQTDTRADEAPLYYAIQRNRFSAK